MTSEQFKEAVANLHRDTVERVDAILSGREYCSWPINQEIGLDGWVMWQRQTREYGHE